MLSAILNKTQVKVLQESIFTILCSTILLGLKERPAAPEDEKETNNAALILINISNGNNISLQYLGNNLMYLANC